MKPLTHTCLFLIMSLLVGSCHKEPAPPNIILILTDDQGWGDLSSNGNRDISTPHIDQLAREGATFDRFFVCPVCSPTRAEILTGRYHTRSGVYSTSEGGERIDLDEKLLSEYLKENGYRTGAFGKWHNGMQPPYHPNSRGFEEFYGFCSGHWGDYYSPMLEHNGELIAGSGFLTDDLVTQAMHFVEKNSDDPFFLYLPLQTPHSPMQVPDRWWQKFADRDLIMDHPDSSELGLLHTRAALAMCENIDYNIGRLLGQVDQLGLRDNTVVLFLSDNGPNGDRWNEGMRGRKGSTDEGGVRSPLIVRWPGQLDAGSKVHEICAGIDLLPTLLDWAGVEATFEQPVDGLSLANLTQGQLGAEIKNRIIFNHWRGRTSLRSLHYRRDHQGRLYAMTSDPSQQNDLSDSLKELTVKYRQLVEDFDASVALELPSVDTRPFPVGDPSHTWTQLPARDAKTTGSIRRSNRWPNDSFYENWMNTTDSIYWEVEVMEGGQFEVDLYYTCRPQDVGCTLRLTSGAAAIQATVDEPHDPPLEGEDLDRYPRQESFTKAFRPLALGTMALESGPQVLTLTAPEIPGIEAIDFRLIMLRRI